MKLSEAIEKLKWLSEQISPSPIKEAIDTVVASYEEESITIELEKKTLLLFAAYMENEMGINIPMSIINNYLENN